MVQKTSVVACSEKHGFREARTKTDVERIPTGARSRGGRRRNPDNWTYSNIPATTFSRSYTGHCLSRSSGKHLDQFGLINMHAHRSFSEGGSVRMYDPLLGRFLSPDPFVANPGFTQDYNRYSYVLNNPLLYTDPTGYQKYTQPYMEYNVGFMNADLFGRHGGGGGSIFPKMGILGGPRI